MRGKKPSQGIIFSVSAASLLFLGWTAQGLVQSIDRAAPFQVEEIQVRWRDGAEPSLERFQLVPPASIFRIDLAAVNRSIEVRYPTATVEAVERVLPNRVVARLISKRVVAQIRSDRYFPVSAEGTVLAEGQQEPWPALPVLFLRSVGKGFQPGDRIEHPNFKPASEVLSAIYRSKGLSGHQVETVRFTRGMMILLLDSGVEIRFDKTRVRENWSRLRDLLLQKPSVLEGAAYLDLRFENPAMGRPQVKR